MMIVWLKFVHVAAIAIWCAGLICLPGLYVQRAHMPDGEELHRLQGFVRFSYVALISPAAYIAIASGIALIFVAGTFVAWFSLKLVFVGMLVGIHILTGLVIVRLFEKGEVYPVWLFIAVTAATILVVLAILFLVLGKPSLDLGILPEQAFEPGALRRIVLDIIPWMTP
jgi:protoporphyrinogen IX oxidase